MSVDPHASLRDQILEQVLRGPGASRPDIRSAAADGIGVPDDLQPLIAKIHASAYRVSDDDVSGLLTTYDEDELFEIILSAALGASRQRLLAGLRVLEDA